MAACHQPPHHSFKLWNLTGLPLKEFIRDSIKKTQYWDFFSSLLLTIPHNFAYIKMCLLAPLFSHLWKLIVPFSMLMVRGIPSSCFHVGNFHISSLFPYHLILPCVTCSSFLCQGLRSKAVIPLATFHVGVCLADYPLDHLALVEETYLIVPSGQTSKPCSLIHLTN